MRRSFSLDFDVDVVLNVGPQFDFGKRGMTARRRVERADAHQPMHARFALQIAVSIAAVNAHHHALDARFFAFAAVKHFDFVAVLLRPAQIHALQHRRPVLRLGAARARVNGEDRVLVVVGAGEQRLQRHALDDF